jgi:hypothetical protein
MLSRAVFARLIVVTLVVAPSIGVWLCNLLLAEPCNEMITADDYEPCSSNYPPAVWCTNRNATSCQQGPGAGDDEGPNVNVECVPGGGVHDLCIMQSIDCLPKLTCNWTVPEGCTPGAAFGGYFTAEYATDWYVCDPPGS